MVISADAVVAQRFFNIEALRRFDILQVDAAEGWLQRGDHFDKAVGVLLVDFNIKHVDAGEFFKQYALALHYRLARQRADIAQPQHGGAVGDHAHQIAARGVLMRGQRILSDFQARRGHARRIGQRQIALRRQRFGGRDLNFPWLWILVKIERALLQLIVHRRFLRLIT